MCGTALLPDRRRAERRAAKAASAARALPAQTPPAAPADHVDDSNHAATSYLGAPSPSSQKPRGEWVRSSGSSFLGLDDEGPSDSEYLLTDEEPRSGGAWRALLALAILAAVGYLVLKNWDSPTFAAAIAQIQKHTQSASNPEPKPPPPPSSEQPSISTDENAASADAQKGSANTSQQDATKTPQQDAQKKEAPDNAAPDKLSGTSADTSPEKKDESASNKESQKSETVVPEEDRNEEPAPADKSNTAKSNSSEPAKSATMPAQDLYERGQAYLSGHGAPQSCDQGVVYTRAAAQQGNPKAAVQMGALYATGRCVSQDRVQAYNWFNQALRNDPNNEYVERSRSTLWAQMTSDERQRAAKSQQ
jgi:Sel1 repeat-containing protein